MPVYRVIVGLEILARNEADALTTAHVCTEGLRGMYSVPDEELTLLGRIENVITPTEVNGVRIESE
jgi:hypothetical protein